MDVQMPEMDGLEATRHIRTMTAATEPSCRIPVIAMTAGAMAQDRQQCFAAGMDDYLTKPLDLSELTRVLSQWLPGQQNKSAEATLSIEGR